MSFLNISPTNLFSQFLRTIGLLWNLSLPYNLELFYQIADMLKLHIFNSDCYRQIDQWNNKFIHVAFVWKHLHLRGFWGFLTKSRHSLIYGKFKTFQVIERRPIIYKLMQRLKLCSSFHQPFMHTHNYIHSLTLTHTYTLLIITFNTWYRIMSNLSNMNNQYLNF